MIHHRMCVYNLWVHSLYNGTVNGTLQAIKHHIVAPGFLKLFLFAHQYVCLTVSVSTPEGVNNHWHDIYIYGVI